MNSEEILRYTLENIDPYILLIYTGLISLGTFITFSGIVEKKDKSAFDYAVIHLKKVSFVLALLLVLLGVVFIFMIATRTLGIDLGMEYMGLLWGKVKSFFADWTMWPGLISIMALPSLIKLLHHRWIKPRLSSWVRKWRVKQMNDNLSDIRTEMEALKAKDFDPRKYFKDGYMFMGLNEEGSPIYIDDETFKKNHAKVLGPSQTGKGVMQGVLIAQAIKKGWGTWFNDLKPDDFIYSIMVQSCKEYGREPPLVLDLTGFHEGIKYAPFENGTDAERIARVTKALRISDSGGTADYYMANNRKILYKIFPLWDGTLKQLSKILDGKHPGIDDNLRLAIQEKAENLSTRVMEWCQQPALLPQKGKGFNVKDALMNNRVVYVLGSMSDPFVRAANIALLDEIVQVAKREQLPGHTFIDADECRFIATDLLADSLATLLSKKVSMAIAYQARNDMKNLTDKTLNAESIQNGIETNTQLMISHRAEDEETATWICEKTGTIAKTLTKLESVETNDWGAEEWEGKRMVGQVEDYLINLNQVKALPPRICVIAQPGVLATLCFTCFIPLREKISLKARSVESINDELNLEKKIKKDEKPKPVVQVSELPKTELPADVKPHSEEEVDDLLSLITGEMPKTDNKTKENTKKNAKKSDAIPSPKPENVIPAIHEIKPEKTNVVVTDEVDLSFLDVEPTNEKKADNTDTKKTFSLDDL